MPTFASHYTFLHQVQDSYNSIQFKNRSRLFRIDEAMEYIDGFAEPHYPVPAIPLRVVVGTEYMYDTVYIETASDEDPVIVALWDFNFDRCMDFGTPLGMYQHWDVPCVRVNSE